MKYNDITPAFFISRPNRFIAKVKLDGKELSVHVKNTGRCKELLIPGCKVYLEKAANPERKTPYDLVAVENDGRIINIDSQAPNAAVREWLLKSGEYDLVKPEYKFGDSRIDFYMERDGEKFLMEVKGCTLFKDGVGYFPDAPTERGAKHLRELTGAIKEGYKSAVAFVIQGEGIYEVRPLKSEHKDVLAIIDGAAFGSEVEFFMRKAENYGAKCVLYAPESFEYILLKSGILGDRVDSDKLAKTYDYADSCKYASWEQFYEAYLTDLSQGTEYRYSKKKLGLPYMTEGNMKKIRNQIPEQIEVEDAICNVRRT